MLSYVTLVSRGCCQLSASIWVFNQLGQYQKFITFSASENKNNILFSWCVFFFSDRKRVYICVFTYVHTCLFMLLGIEPGPLSMLGVCCVNALRPFSFFIMVGNGNKKQMQAVSVLSLLVHNWSSLPLIF